MEALRQPIELFFTEPKAAPKGLAATLALLKEIEAHTARLNAGPAAAVTCDHVLRPYEVSGPKLTVIAPGKGSVIV